MEEEEKDIKKSGRELLVERLKVKHPDIDDTNDESIYSVINSDYEGSDVLAEDNKRMKDSLDKMLQVFDKHPDAASLYVDLARGGTSVLEYLIERYGDDFLEALRDRDPEMIAKITAAENKYRSRLAQEESMRVESEENLTMSLDALDEAANMAGISEEDKDRAFSAFVSVIDDAIRNKVSVDTWQMFIKGLNHDKDVEAAEFEGEVRGRNAKILEKVKKPEERVPPMLGGQGGNPKRPSYGGFLDVIPEGDWLSRAKQNK